MESPCEFGEWLRMPNGQPEVIVLAANRRVDRHRKRATINGDLLAVSNQLSVTQRQIERKHQSDVRSDVLVKAIKPLSNSLHPG